MPPWRWTPCHIPVLARVHGTACMHAALCSDGSTGFCPPPLALCPSGSLQSLLTPSPFVSVRLTSSLTAAPGSSRLCTRANALGNPKGCRSRAASWAHWKSREKSHETRQDLAFSEGPSGLSFAFVKNGSETGTNFRSYKPGYKSPTLPLLLTITSSHVQHYEAVKVQQYILASLRSIRSECSPRPNPS